MHCLPDAGQPYYGPPTQLEAAQQAASADVSALGSQLKEQRASAAAAASKARGDQLVLAKEVKRLREELAAAHTVCEGGGGCVCFRRGGAGVL